MYTKKELERRVFAPDKEARIDAALKDYRSNEEAQVQTVERGIILPLKRIAGTESYAGGVCDAGGGFVAGFRRNLEKQVAIDCLQSYVVDGGGCNIYMKPLSLAARHIPTLGMRCWSASLAFGSL